MFMVFICLCLIEFLFQPCRVFSADRNFLFFSLYAGLEKRGGDSVFLFQLGVGDFLFQVDRVFLFQLQ